MTTALVVGESVVDVVTADGLTTERPGGSAANVAVALARLGRSVGLATAFAADARGARLSEHLTAAGVVLVGDPHVVERTATARATIGADGAASYGFDIDWRLGPVPERAPGVLHVCSLGAVLEPGASAVRELLARGTAGLVSYDVNARPSITGAGPDVVAAVEAVAARAHLVKASDEDLAALYPSMPIDAAAAHLRALGPRAVVVTRGADGSTWFGETTVWAPVQAVTVVDTIGAGDTFSAAMIDALWDDVDERDVEWDPAQVLAHAHRAAAVTVSRAGADPPTRADLARSATGRSQERD